MVDHLNAILHREMDMFAVITQSDGAVKQWITAIAKTAQIIVSNSSVQFCVSNKHFLKGTLRRNFISED